MVNDPDTEALKALYESYFAAWNRQDLAALVDLFAFPVVVGGGGRAPTSIPDAQVYRGRLQALLDDLSERGWTISVLDELHVGIMAGDTGVITVHYHRDRADGSKLEGGTSNYLTRKLDGRWKFIGMIVP